jgi:hypothetical protein
LTVRSTLAAIYRKQSKRQEAERLWREVLEVQRRVLGDTHPDTLDTMVVLGEFLVEREGKFDEAEPLLLEALKGCRQALDRNHLATDGALAGLAALYALRKDVKKLGPVLLEALEITRLRYGPDHALTAGGNEAAGSFFL